MALLETKHQVAFGAAIHDADPGGDLRVLCYSRNDKLTRKYVVSFWQVVGTYLADIGDRTGTGGGQTAAHIVAAALVQIKADINRGVYTPNIRQIPYLEPHELGYLSTVFIFFLLFLVFIFLFLFY